MAAEAIDNTYPDQLARVNPELTPVTVRRTVWAAGGTAEIPVKALVDQLQAELNAMGVSEDTEGYDYSYITGVGPTGDTGGGTGRALAFGANVLNQKPDGTTEQLSPDEIERRIATGEASSLEDFHIIGGTAVGDIRRIATAVSSDPTVHALEEVRLKGSDGASIKGQTTSSLLLRACRQLKDITDPQTEYDALVHRMRNLTDGQARRAMRDLGVSTMDEARELHAAAVDAVLVFEFKLDSAAEGQHPLNTFMAACLRLNGVGAGFELANRALRTRCDVRPITLDPTCMRLVEPGGVITSGEKAIDNRRITHPARVIVDPVANINPIVAAAFNDAEEIGLGPGSVFTSMWQFLGVNGVPAAINRSRAKVTAYGNAAEDINTVGWSATPTKYLTVFTDEIGVELDGFVYPSDDLSEANGEFPTVPYQRVHHELRRHVARVIGHPLVRNYVGGDGRDVNGVVRTAFKFDGPSMLQAAHMLEGNPQSQNNVSSFVR